MSLSVPIPQRGNTISANPMSLSAGEGLIFDFGRIYFVCEKKMGRTLSILQDFVFSGSNALCITRLHPDLLLEQMPGVSLECTWLSERPGQANIPPNQLHRISQRIGMFLMGKKNAVVLLEGVEYLTLFNDPTKVQMFLEQVNDQIMASKALMLVPLDPLSMDPRYIARLRRFAEIVAPCEGI